MYLRLQEAREQRLRLLTKNIQSAHANKPKGKNLQEAAVVGRRTWGRPSRGGKSWAFAEASGVELLCCLGLPRVDEPLVLGAWKPAGVVSVCPGRQVDTHTPPFSTGRQAKMAFVNSVAKPPRDVRRRQEKFGTGGAVVADKIK